MLYVFIFDRNGEGEFDFLVRRVTADSGSGVDLCGENFTEIVISAVGEKKKKMIKEAMRARRVSVTSWAIAREECTEIGSINAKRRAVFAERADQYRSHMSLHSLADKLHFACQSTRFDVERFSCIQNPLNSRVRTRVSRV